ncbi:MAG: hypothetical protein FJ145_20215 [Deltaproteobacteria bacterium]|nr:hypothetical protein [Deltaproteobacteria bacterium]
MQQENWKLRAREYRRIMYGVMAGALLFAPALVDHGRRTPSISELPSGSSRWKQMLLSVSGGLL